MNRTLSGRRRSSGGGGLGRFSISTFRGPQQLTMSKKLNRVIKNENSAISAYESAGRQRVSIAAQLSEWGESTEDDAVSDISDKLGVLMAEMGEQEDIYAQNLDEYRNILKHIRDTESSVQPTRNQRAKIADDIQKAKWKEPNSHKIDTLEQELVRAEAQNLVAEAQLTNVTRQRLKEAFDVHTAAVIERAEKQILLAQHARRLLNILDDSPVVPGDTRKEYDRAIEARQIIDEAENDIRSWESTVDPIETSAGAVAPSTLLPAPARRAPEAEAPSQEQEAPSEVSVTNGYYGEPRFEEIQAEERQVPGLQMEQQHRERVHSVEAPMMEPELLEGQGDQSVSALAPEMDRAAISDSNREVNGSVPDTDFIHHKTGSERPHLIGALGTQAQPIAVPI